MASYYLNYTIQHLVENFYCCKWGWNGPTNIGRSYMLLQSGGKFGSSGVDVTNSSTGNFSEGRLPIVDRRIVALAPREYYYPLPYGSTSLLPFLKSTQSYDEWSASMGGKPATLHWWSQNLWGNLDSVTAHTNRLPTTSLPASIMRHSCPALYERCVNQTADGKICSLKWEFDGNFSLPAG